MLKSRRPQLYRRVEFLQRAAKLALQALHMLWHIRPSVCPSVRLSFRHTPVLCQNDGTQRDAVFTLGSPVSLVFLRREWLMGDDPVQVNLSAKRSTPAKTAELYTFRLITTEP